MNATALSTPIIIGVDTRRRTLRLLAVTSSDRRPGAVIPEYWESFQNLSRFSRYWNEHWRGRGARVAVSSDTTDPLQARDWLKHIAQPVEVYQAWHLRGDRTLQDLGIDERYRRSYVLALHACHRAKAREVLAVVDGALLEARSLLAQVQQSVFRLAAAIEEPLPPEF